MLKRLTASSKTADWGRPANGPLRVLAFVASSEFEQQLNGLCGGDERVDLSVVSRNSIDPRDFPLTSQPDFVVLELSGEIEADLELIRDASKSGWRTHAQLVAAAAGYSDSTVLRLIRSGADDYLNQPISREEFERVISRRGARPAVGASGTAGATLTFVHASGGAGATTLAVNTAIALHTAAQPMNLSACVLDLDLQFGAVGIQLDLEGHSPISELLAAPDRLDKAMLDAMMQKHASGLRVLTSPETPLPYDALDRETVGRMIKLARRRFDYAVIDLPSALVDWTDEVLRLSNRIFLVTQATVPSLRQARRLLRTMEAESLEDLPVSIVVNRFNERWSGNERISMQQIEGALGRDVEFTINSDFELASAAVDQGIPVVSLKPAGRMAKQIEAMISAYLPREVQKPQTRSPVQRLLGVN